MKRKQFVAMIMSSTLVLGTICSGAVFAAETGTETLTTLDMPTEETASVPVPEETAETAENEETVTETENEEFTVVAESEEAAAETEENDSAEEPKQEDTIIMEAEEAEESAETAAEEQIETENLTEKPVEADVAVTEEAVDLVDATELTELLPAVGGSDDTNQEERDKDVKRLKDTTLEMATEAFKYLPYGRVFMPMINNILTDFGLIEEKEDSSVIINEKLDDISEKCDELSLKIDEFQSSVKEDLRSVKEGTDGDGRMTRSKIETTGVIQNYGKQVDEMYGDAMEIYRQIGEIKEMTDLTEAEKTALIAGYIGSHYSWTSSSNIIAQFRNSMNTLIGNSLEDPKGRDFFQIVYDDVKLNHMFAADAHADTADYLNTAVLENLSTYGVIIECLNAQKKLASFTEEEIASITNEEALAQYNAVKGNFGFINGKVDELTRMIMDCTEDSSLGTHYANYMNRDLAAVFTDQGRTASEVKLNKTLAVYNYTGHQWSDMESYWIYFSDAGEGKRATMEAMKMIEEGIKNDIINKSAFTEDQVRHLAEEAKQKHLTIRELLKQNGFNTDSIPKDSFLYAGGYKRVRIEVWSGSEAGVWESSYSGVSIDDPDCVINDHLIIGIVENFADGCSFRKGSTDKYYSTMVALQY